jgi:hypothetical protein
MPILGKSAKWRQLASGVRSSFAELRSHHWRHERYPEAELRDGCSRHTCGGCLRRPARNEAASSRAERAQSLRDPTVGDC